MKFKRKNLLVALICLLMIGQSKVAVAQDEENDEALTAANFDLVATTNDVLYIDSVVHMMDQSPLSPFGEYKKILFDGSVTEKYTLKERGTCAAIGLKDKEYSAEWVVVDSMLYMSDVSFLYAVGKKMVIPKMVNGKLEVDLIDCVISDKYYQSLEILTRSKFLNRKFLIYSNVPVSRFGLMPCSMVYRNHKHQTGH